MRVLVTGASGYIGRHVVSELIKRGHHVLVADKKNYFKNSDQLTVIKEKIFSANPDIFSKMGKPDSLIHLAWSNGFQHNHDCHILTLRDHYTFIRDMLKGGLKQVVGMGTMHEVGFWEGCIDENTPTNPASMYGIAKNDMRQFTRLLAQEYGAVYQWVRAFYITGDDENNHSVFTKIIGSSNDGETTFPFTSGKNEYDFIDIKELARQIVAVNEQTDVCGIINCCSGIAMPLGKRVEQFIQENKLPIRLKYNVFPDRPYDSREVWGDNSKIREVLSLQRRS